MVSVATPLSPGSSASGHPLVPGSPTGEGRFSPESAPPAIPDHELLCCIGRGSYGEVWLARNVLGQYRAVKFIHRAHFDSDHAYEREFEGLKRYEPVSRGAPSQVAVLHVGRHDAAGFYYYAMELADDSNAESDKARRSDGVLESRSDAARHSITPSLQYPNSPPLQPSISSYTPRTLKSDVARRKRLPLDECIEIGLALTTALEHLHGHGLIHRDIKPSNVVFIGGVPKLADIGLVAAMDATMSFVGTAGYMPPEGPGKPTADIYSLGKVLYEISVGRDTTEFPELPTAWESFAEQKQQLEFNAVVLKACATDPAQRYHTAREMHEDLALLREGKSVRHRQLVQQRWASSRRMALVALMIGVFTLSAYALYRAFVGPREMVPASADHPVAVPLKASVFVLPFRSAGSNEVSVDLCSRVTDSFIDSLALIEGVRHSPRKSGWRYLDEDDLRQALAKTNSMRHVLTGRVSSSDDLVGLTLSLYKRGNEQPQWTESFSAKTNELIALERRALSELTARLGLSINTNEEQRIGTLLTNNLEALRCYQQAVAVYARSSGTLVAAKDIRELAQKAMNLDANYVDGDYMDAYMVRCFFGDRASSDVWPDVRRRMLKLLETDDTYDRALDQFGGYLLFYERDWDGAYAAWNSGLRYCPKEFRDFRAALYYRIHGWFAQARLHQERCEQPDPSDIDVRFFMAAARWTERRYAEGVKVARRTLELYPGQPRGYQWLAHCLIGNGEYEAGIQATHQAQEVSKRQEMTALRAVAYAKWGGGQQGKAREVLQELLEVQRTGPYLQPYFVARVYSALDEKEKALDWLEKAERDRTDYLFVGDLGGGLRIDPAWDGLQNESRYWHLCERLGLGKNQWPRPKPKLSSPER